MKKEFLLLSILSGMAINCASNDNAITQKNQRIIERMDKYIREHYEKSDADYYKNGYGKFEQYCDDNKCDSDCLEYDLKNRDGCLLLAFDKENFPYKNNSYDDNDAKDQEVYTVLKNSYKEALAVKEKAVIEISGNLGFHYYKSSLRRRGFSEKKNFPSLDAQKQAQNDDIRNQLINKVVAMYALDAHKLKLYGIKELQERDYSSHEDDENESCVSFYACKYLLLLAESHIVNEDKYDKAQALYNTAKEILVNNEKDENFDILGKYLEKTNPILNSLLLCKGSGRKVDR